MTASAAANSAHHRPAVRDPAGRIAGGLGRVGALVSSSGRSDNQARNHRRVDRLQRWRADRALAGMGRARLLVFAAAFAAIVIWWQRIKPSNERLWADDVAQIPAATFDGNRVTLQQCAQFRLAQQHRLHAALGNPRLRSSTAEFSRHDHVVLGRLGDRAHADFVRFRRRASMLPSRWKSRRDKRQALFGDRRLLQGVRTQHHRGRRARCDPRAHQRARRGRLSVSHSHAAVRDALAVPRLPRANPTASSARRASTTPLPSTAPRWSIT